MISSQSNNLPSSSSSTNVAPLLLAVILDCNPHAWRPLAFNAALAQLLVFCNAHLASDHRNKLVIYAAFTGSSKLLYPSPSAETLQTQQEIDTTTEPENKNAYPLFQEVEALVRKGIAQEFYSNGRPDAPFPNLAGALSLALCHVNRLKNDATESLKRSGLDARCLIISVSEDDPSQYIVMMNSLFAAQKLAIPIDVCKLAGFPCAFLQQAAHITGGIFKLIKEPFDLLQNLLSVFLTDSKTRSFLKLNSAPMFVKDEEAQGKVDLRAVCFCHKRPVNIGHVCSICLSIFCAFIPICSTCG